MKRSLMALETLTAFLFGAANVQAQNPLYTITDLGLLSSDPHINASEAAGINNAGQVVGLDIFSNGGHTNTGVFIYSNGSRVTIGNPYPNAPSPSGSNITASAINDSGQVVGRYFGSAYPFGPAVSSAYVYQNGKFQDISLAQPYAINNAGLVVGQGEGSHAAMYSNGVETQLNLGNQFSSVAYGVNNAGQIAGTDGLNAFVYQNGTETVLPLIAGARAAQANALNDIGKIVGFSYVGDHYAATLWQNGQAADLGTLGGASAIAAAINKNGDIVGGSQITSIFRSQTAFVYHNGTMYDVLAGAGVTWGSASAYGINDAGQIVGTAVFTGDGKDHAFLATPQAPVVPAPGSLLAAVLGGGLLAVRLRRKRK